MGIVQESTHNMVFNFFDFLNKIAFCLAIWACTKTSSHLPHPSLHSPTASSPPPLVDSSGSDDLPGHIAASSDSGATPGRIAAPGGFSARSTPNDALHGLFHGRVFHDHLPYPLNRQLESSTVHELPNVDYTVHELPNVD